MEIMTSRTLLRVSAFFAVSFWLNAALGNPVTADEAGQAVGNWLSYSPQLGCKLGDDVAGVRTCTTTNGVSFHVVKLVGGGFVVTSADTADEPIVAFSSSDDLVESDGNPLWVMLTRDFSARSGLARSVKFAAVNATATAVSTPEQKWSQLLPVKGGVVRLTHMAAGREMVSDVRVSPILKTKWSQEQDSYYSNRGDPCYNYYTPNQYPCGCVATATAQIMRHHRFPTAAVTPGSYLCRVETDKQWIDTISYYPIYTDTMLTMQGGVYDWDSMPLVPANGTTLQQRQAIGKLTSDIGIACGMSYGEYASSAGGYMAAKILPECFGYASAVAACSSRSLSVDLVRRAFCSNLDAGLPVIAGLSDGYNGHAVVADGYGYSMSTFYVHFNFGWAGKDDAWYAPPNVAEYTSIDTLVYNIYPEGAANGVICSGRVTDADGNPIFGATVTAVGASSASDKTDASGIYSFILTPGSYTISVGRVSTTVKLVANVGMRITERGSYIVETPEVNNQCDINLVVAGEVPVDSDDPDEPIGDDWVLFTDDEPLCADVTKKAWTYNAFVVKDDEIVGTLQVTTAKAGRDGSVKVKATYLVRGGKTALTGTMKADSEGAVALSGKGMALTVRLGEQGITGSLDDGAVILGSRNMLGEKSASATLASFKGGWTAVIAGYFAEDEEFIGYAPLSISIGAKGATKVSGTLPDGAKVNFSTTLIVDEKGAGYVAVDAPLYSKKGGFSILMRLCPEGSIDLVSEPVWDTTGAKRPYNVEMVTYMECGASVASSGLSDGQCNFGVDAEAFGEGVVEEALPLSVSLNISRGKISVPASGMVQYKNDDIVISGDNPSALKLTCTVKTGALKGTFNVYRVENGRLKSYPATVTGSVVGEWACMSVTVKKLGITTAGWLCYPDGFD